MANMHMKPGPGRPKGSKDKLPKALKDRVVAVWNQLEAEGKGLYETAKVNPEWFYNNFVKPMLPKDIEVNSGPDADIVMIFDFVGNDRENAIECNDYKNADTPLLS